MCFSTPSTPPPEQPPEPTTTADTQVQDARVKEKRTTGASQGAISTILTNQALPDLGVKTLLGA